jgi:hypothetical protein
MAARQVMYVPMEVAVPATPTRAQNNSGSVKIDEVSKIVAMVLNTTGKTGFVSEGGASVEKLRTTLQYVMNMISTDAASLTLRPGDKRIAPEPQEVGEDPIPHRFPARYNILLFQILSMVCITGEAETVVGAYAEEQDGRAALLSLLHMCEPQGSDAYSRNGSLKVLSTTEIYSTDSPLTSFAEMIKARKVYDRNSTTAMDNDMFMSFLTTMLAKNVLYASVSDAIDQGLLVVPNAAALQVMVMGVYNRKIKPTGGSSSSVAKSFVATEVRKDTSLKVSTFPKKKNNVPLCRFCPSDGLYHYFGDCPVLAPQLVRKNKPEFDPHQGQGGRGGAGRGIGGRGSATAAAGALQNFWDEEDGMQLAVAGAVSAPVARWACIFAILAVMFGVIALCLALSNTIVLGGTACVSRGNVTFRVDSGCTDHVVSSPELVHYWDANLPPKYFDTAGGRVLAKGGGYCVYDAMTKDGLVEQVVLRPVYYLPGQDFNLVSVQQLVYEDNWESPEFRMLQWENPSGIVFSFSRIRREFVWSLHPAEGNMSGALSAVNVPPGMDGDVQDGVIVPGMNVSRPEGSARARKVQQSRRMLGNISAIDPNVTADSHLRVEAARKLKIPLQEKSVSSVSRDTSDWQVLRSAVKRWMVARAPKNVLDVDLFTDGKGPVEGNSHCDNFYSVEDDAFDHLWAGNVYLANPPYYNDVIQRMFLKVLQDFRASPDDTHAFVTVPDIPGAVWYPLLGYFETLEVHPEGTMFYTCPAGGTYATDDLQLAGDEGGPNRVFIRGTPWPVIVAYKGPLTPAPVNPYTLVHMRFAHASATSISRMVEHGVDLGVKLEAGEVKYHLPPHTCAVCEISKAVQPSFDRASQSFLDEILPFQYVCSDLTGPISPVSPKGLSHAVVFTCVKTKWKFPACLTRKLDILEVFIEFTTMVKAFGFKVENMVFQSDAEAVYLSGAFAEHLGKLGIKQINSPPYLKQMNGLAENVFRNLWPMVRSMFNNMAVDMKHWPHGVMHAIWLRNRLPDSSLGFKSPFEVLYGYPPILAEVRIFWSPVYAWIHPDNRTKLADAAFAGVYVGHTNSSSAMKVLDPGTGKIFHRGRANVLEDKSLAGRLMGGVDLKDVTVLSFVDHFTTRPVPFLKHLPMCERNRPQKLKILAHHAWYDKDNHESVAILSVSCHQYPEGVWVTTQTFLLESKDAVSAWSSLARYLSYRLLGGNLNSVYPLFTMVVSSIPKFPVGMECIVVSLDTSSSDSASVLYGLVHSPEHEMAYCDVQEKFVVFPDDTKSDSVICVVTQMHTAVEAGMVSFSAEPISMYGGVAALAKPANIKCGIVIPLNYRHATMVPQVSNWMKCSDAEIASLHENKVFKQFAKVLPAGVKAVDAGFIYDLKTTADGLIDVSKASEGYKGRFVVRGYMQVPGIHYDPESLYSPTASDVSLMVLFSLVVKLDLKFKHVDVKTAFLNSPLEEEIWIRFPQGFVHGDGDKFALLGKAIYGLHQATYNWNRTQHAKMVEFDKNIIQSKSDPCFYALVKPESDFYFFVSLHVDDYAIGYSHEDYYARWVLSFRQHFGMVELGDVSHLLGMRILRTPTTLSIDHVAYIERLAFTFGVSGEKSVATPMLAHLHLKPNPGGSEPGIPFRELNGSLLWPARKTHPEILWSVVYLSQFNSAYGREHHVHQLRVLEYLYSARHRPLTFRKPVDGPSQPLKVVVYSDSDFAEDVTDRKSYSGSVSYLDGNIVSWNSSRQRYVAGSSAESEYVAVAEACKDGLHLIHFLSEFMPVALPATVMIDNIGAKFMAQNDLSNKRTKHIDLRYHMIRDYIKQGFFVLKYVCTTNNVADILTKALERLKHEVFTNALLRDYFPG